MDHDTATPDWRSRARPPTIEGRPIAMSTQTIPTDISRVERVPGVVGGNPVVKGTRIPVASVVIAAREYSGVDGVRDAYPQLTAEDVADALAYYLLHREDVDRHIADLSDESSLDEDGEHALEPGRGGA